MSTVDCRDRTVLVTGGTGSFGRTATRMLLAAGCREVRVLSRDELKQDVMRREVADPRLRFHVGDVRDRDSVDAAMRGVDWVFHAAALKQVPSCEFFPMQAVMTNIIGTHHVIEIARRHEVERVVCLSTDKAAYPINAMGMTKGLAEKVAQASARLRTGGDTVVAAVRYGNVLCSRGSVVPLFVEQIRAGGPVTMTDPAMTRFLLSLPEALELVLFALVSAEPGDLFIRKAPACTISDLSKALQHLLDTEVEEEIIGIRHGEKLFETLATREELTRAEDCGDYYRIVMDDRDLNYGKYFGQGTFGGEVVDDYTSHNTARLSVAEVQHVLEALPEIQAQMAPTSYGVV
jgi:UDP-glucose 4-epimerase